jgi:N-acetyl-gamma-glutamyl-phosphate reductase
MSTAKNIRAGIIGGAGYTGGEMLRILLRHPHVTLSFVHSKSNAGKFLYNVHEDLIGETDKTFDSEWSYDVDVLFLCLGHGEARKFIGEHSPVTGAVKIIDLSQDYRLGHPLLDGQPVIYGLPELNREAIRTARHIANPGCFATALQLGLLPLAKTGLVGDVYTTGITGSTGAGQSLSATSHFSWRANNIQAYKTLTHQHLNEVGQSLQQVGGADVSIHFVPWRGDFTRGIFVTSQLRCERRSEEVLALYQTFYQDHPFTIVSQQAISLKQVVNTNKCLIQLEQQGSQLVIHSAIDNLTKGASGQAVQNMNLLFGLEETAGLHLKATAF